MTENNLRYCSKCQTFHSLDNFYRDAHRKDGLQSQCKSCIKNRTKTRHKTKPEVKKKYDSNHYLKNRQKRIAYAKDYEKANKQRHWVAATKWRLSKEDYGKYWANYKATKLQATVKWANKFFISEIYKLAKLREKITGGKWHVDHIVPLRSDLVCGLHWEGNLQVLQASVNISKGNRFWPDS